jgi:hypothetical protein
MTKKKNFCKVNNLHKKWESGRTHDDEMKKDKETLGIVMKYNKLWQIVWEVDLRNCANGTNDRRGRKDPLNPSLSTHSVLGTNNS